MPITSVSLDPIEQEDFARLDYQVMRHAFECQNELGRLCDEVIYQNDLAGRLEGAGLPTLREVPVTVTHRDFAKIYLLDLVVAQAGIYELKTVAALAGAHEAQLLNYLFLCGSRHGKLVNFRPASVESRFLNATLSQAERRQFSVEADGWLEPDQTDQFFREGVVRLLQDWGCGLDLELYTEALIHFAAGEDRVAQMLPLTPRKWLLGNATLPPAQPGNGVSSHRADGGNSGLRAPFAFLASPVSAAPHPVGELGPPPSPIGFSDQIDTVRKMGSEK
jgi:GxxExxY protein